MSVSLGIVRKGSLFTAEYPVQKIFDEIADFGVRCPQVGVVAQTHAVAHFAARCPLFTSSSKRWFKATAASSRPGRSYSCQSSAVAWTVIVIVSVIHVLLHVGHGRSSSPIPDLPTRSHNPSRMRELEPA